VGAQTASPTGVPDPGLGVPGPQLQQLDPPLQATVTVQLDRPLRSFTPKLALGGALDGHEAGEVGPIYTAGQLRLMKQAGLGAVTYRLRTELGAQAWQFQPVGSYSEADRRQGYWTGSATPSGPAPKVSWGYDLPRRGDTIDQADDSGYSRLDDGATSTFWKSDPYLDSHFTHEREAAHAQWVLVELPWPEPLDALRIDWAAPWARHLSVQYFVGQSAVMLEGDTAGYWRQFPDGKFRGHAGTETLHLAGRPVMARFVRLVMYGSSHTALADHPGLLDSVPAHPGVPPSGPTHPGLPHSRSLQRGRPAPRDVRDRLGYAIREIYLGTLDASGKLQDVLVHERSKRQTVIYTSSSDSWHTAKDRNTGYEQPSFQTVLASGLTRGEPVLVPVSVLYGTPEDAVAELRYLRALHVPIRGVELGEEPDGQLASPEDYGALYVQFARAIRRVFRHLPLGGPSFQTSVPDWLYWPDAHGDRSWTHRFVDFLRSHHALDLLSFFSFEWYPYDDVCLAAEPQLLESSALLTHVIELQHEHGVPRTIPMYISEYGYSAFAGEDEVTMPGALLDADTVGTFLQDGGSTAYLYGYEPAPLLDESEFCSTWGNLALIEDDEQTHELYRLATFWETRMLTHDWLAAGGARLRLYPTRTSAVQAASGTSGWAAGGERVRAYAVRGPRGALSVLLLNLSATQPDEVTLRAEMDGQIARLRGRAQEWQLSSADYGWTAAGEAGRPSLDEPPLHATRARGTRVLLPPYSITVLRSALG
jgi:hypothetical protein